jgi:hypothetical protein
MPDIKPHRIFTNNPKSVKMVGFCSSPPRHSDSATKLYKAFLGTSRWQDFRNCMLNPIDTS